MGQISRNSRAARFVREFDQDFVRNYGLPDEMLALDEDGETRQGLALDEAFNVIRLYAELREAGGDDGDSVEVVVERAGFIDTEDDEKDMVDFLTEKLNIDEDTARARLRKAKLIEG